ERDWGAPTGSPYIACEGEGALVNPKSHNSCLTREPNPRTKTVKAAPNPATSPAPTKAPQQQATAVAPATTLDSPNSEGKNPRGEFPDSNCTSKVGGAYYSQQCIQFRKQLKASQTKTKRAQTTAVPLEQKESDAGVYSDSSCTKKKFSYYYSQECIRYRKSLK
ncbi:MAG: hypothetical protein AB3N23_03225, partial [Paracoccaceae bacterium]